MGEVAPLAPDDPREIGGYRLEGRLGAGGQGVVYLGRAKDWTPVAVKVLHGDGDFDAQQSLLRELGAARRVASFCTARILDAGPVGERDGYVVTEFVEGPTLEQAVRDSGPMGGADLHRLAVGTITALTAIHAAGLVHGDFKPANVLMSSGGPRVIDFGVARPPGRPGGLVVGTPAYMAPEQVAGGPVGAEADVYAWAATMAYAASGRPDMSGVAEPLRTLLGACLAREPQARPAAREVLLKLLEQGDLEGSAGHDTNVLLAEGATIAATRQVSPAEIVPTPRGRRRALLLGGVVGLAAGALIAGLTVAALRPGAPSHEASTAANSATPTVSPAAPAQVAQASLAAMASAGKARFTFQSEGQDEDYFSGDGRFSYAPTGTADYDMNVTYGGDESTAEVILIGEDDYVNESDGWEKGAGSDASDAARRIRWASSPFNIRALTLASNDLRSGGGSVLQGTAGLAELASDGAVGEYYRAYSEADPSGVVSFAMDLNGDHTPRQLKLELPSNEAGSLTVVVGYSGWGGAQDVTAPYVH
ncbi:serine/threonine protein kinase [Actinomadura barringtoniae]|uniref:Serine/threonine protein kinase n=1 Tax=Actinomadura barringtoniae TaxID=1427535 RepID=A0A939TE47_9ACTN|nr:serine/threonine-protein kinase [Actinomadura barringtoniae]MBO2452965.1 serine/threonine protein kinase [Actinomadura barringtoniae]